jgi:SurA N-terminal domain
MKSPFAIFRKHQKMAMAILTGLSMFAFVVMDQLKADSQYGLPIVAAAIGMLLFGIFGYRRGETVTWAVAGTALGVAMAVIAMRFGPGGPKPAVQTAVGDISREELNKLVTRRNTANNFLRLAFEKAVPPRSNNPMFLNYYEQQLRSVMFGFGRDRGEDASNDVILGYLLDKEADEMGLSVSDGTISDYINKVTNDKLTPSDYADILKSQRLTDGQVYDAIRGELRARLAMEMLIPRATSTPEQYWDDYRKLQTTQTLDVAAVPIADFLAEAPQPTDEDIHKYFNTWKGIPAAAPGAPGLFQQRRARIEFVEADFAEVEKQVAAKPVTDAEVKKYYEDHKQEYRNRPPAGASNLSPLMQTPNALSDPNLSAPSAPILPPPGPEFPAAKQPTAPNLPAPSPPVAPPAKQTAPSGASGSKSTPAPKSNGGTSKSGASLDRPTLAPGGDGEMLALADGSFDPPVQLADQSSPPAKSATGPAETKPAVKTQPADEKSHVKPPAPQGPREPKPPALPRSAGSTKTESVPEFRPLDDLLQREIRDQILRNRTIEEMKVRTQAADGYMKTLRDKLIPAEIGGEPAMNAEQRAQALTDFAAKHALKYGITPLMSPYELHEAVDRFPIAAATEPVENPFENKQPIDVIQEAFGTRAESLFQPAQADDRDTHWFAFWKVEDVAEHTPALDEPGVREQVIRGWQIETFAQKAAETRAKELGDLARKSTKPMAEALAGQTVTNKPKGPAVVVIPTTPFSWYTTSSTAPQGLMPETAPRLSEIVGVKEADETFMKTIFDELKVGDVKAVPNFGPSVYYVVRVKSRHPENAEQLAVFRAQFMKENFYGSFLGASTYEYLNAPAEQKLRYEWGERLEAKYGVHRNLEEEPVRQTRSRGRAG